MLWQGVLATAHVWMSGQLLVVGPLLPLKRVFLELNSSLQGLHNRRLYPLTHFTGPNRTLLSPKSD